MIRAKYSSRAAGVSSFESVSPSRRLASPGRSTHAATTSGPAHAPRPASSTPATGPSPWRCSVVCSVQVPAERRTTARAGRHSERQQHAAGGSCGHRRRACRSRPAPGQELAPSSRSAPAQDGRAGAGRSCRARPGRPHPRRPAPPRVCGSGDGIVPIRANGSTMNRARPMTLEIGHGAVAGHPGVGRVVAAVAHHPQRARGHRDRPERVLPGRARLGQEVDVGLVERLAVDEHPVARVAALRRSGRRRR